jgi:hypothetical protein
MVSRLILWSLLAGAILAGGLIAHKKGVWNMLALAVQERLSDESQRYSPTRFRVDLVDRLNYARMGAKKEVLRLDPEMDEWVQKHFPTLVIDDLDALTKKIQEALPRYYQVSVCTAESPTLRVLLDEFQDFSSRMAPEMTHLGIAVRPSMGGLTQQALVVVGQRLHDFSPEVLAERQDEAFFSRCLHCKHPHIVRVSRNQSSLGLECPQCRRTYAVVAADSKRKFRYVNEFLTGYAPPAVFPKDISRIYQLFTICSAVHGNCIYTRDPGVKKDATDAWQTSLETQRLGQGDCEDSAIYLCDWLISQGYNARVALGRYGDLGGHAWVVVKMNDMEYLLESTESAPDPRDPPLVSKVGSRYVPEVLFDRFALYVRSTPGQAWRGNDGYFSGKLWSRIEPRSLNPSSEPIPLKKLTADSGKVDPAKMARTSEPNPAAAPFMELEEIPRDAAVWQMPLSVGAQTVK